MVTRAGPDRYRLLDTLARLRARRARRPRRRRHPRPPRRLLRRARRAGRGRRSVAHDQLEWLDRFRSDINNFRAALEWCLLTGDVDRAARLAGALAWFWTLNGMLTEAIQHLEAPRRDRRRRRPPTRAKCLWGYALLAASLGRLETARDAGYRAVELARSLRGRLPPPTASTPSPSPSGPSATTNTRWMPTARPSRSLDQLDDRWGLALCKVLQARTLFDLRRPRRGRRRRPGRRPRPPRRGPPRPRHRTDPDRPDRPRRRRPRRRGRRRRRSARPPGAHRLHRGHRSPRCTSSATRTAWRATSSGAHLHRQALAPRLADRARRRPCARRWKTSPAPRPSNDPTSPPRCCERPEHERGRQRPAAAPAGRRGARRPREDARRPPALRPRRRPPVRRSSSRSSRG